MAEGTEIFVRNDKGTEYVGTVSCEAAPLPPTLVFTDYTREPSVLDGTKDPKHPDWAARKASLQETKEGVSKFVGFLRGRKKAAIAQLDSMVVALLPSETLEIACFFDENASQKRPRDDESDVGFGAFPSFDVVDDNARKAFSAQLPLWNKKTARRDHSEAMVFRDDKGGAVFFQDARRRYEFFCGERGLLLLSGLLARTALVLEKNEEELKKLF